MGRPLKYTTPDAFTRKCDEYFSENKPDLWSRSSWLLWLDVGKDWIIEYEKKAGYSESIKKSHLKIESSIVASMRSKKQVAGDIFTLKQKPYGWVDKQELDITSGGFTIIDASGLIKQPGKGKDAPEASQ